MITTYHSAARQWVESVCNIFVFRMRQGSLTGDVQHRHIHLLTEQDSNQQSREIEFGGIFTLIFFGESSADYVKASPLAAPDQLLSRYSYFFPSGSSNFHPIPKKRILSYQRTISVTPIGSFTVAIFISFSISFSAHFHHSHHFFKLFSFILTFSLPTLMRMKEKSLKK